MVPGRFFHGSRSVFMFFHDSRLVFIVLHDSMLVFQGSRLVFMVPGGFSWFQVSFHGSRSVFMVPGRISWFLVGFHGFSWFQVVFFTLRTP